jgi:alpha-tubulin suppressor-like RCC1 family protein
MRGSHRITAGLVAAAAAAAIAPHAGAVQIFGVAAGANNTGFMSPSNAFRTALFPTVTVGGENASGQKGVIAANSTSLNSVNVPGYPRSIAFGPSHVIAALDNGLVVTWGDPGEWLGRVASADPDPIPGAASPGHLRDARQVAAGNATSYVLTNKGKVWSFGSNIDGALGNGTLGGTSMTPIQLPDLQGIVQIASQCYSAAVVDADGNVWAWGRNADGQLGQGASGSASGTPARVPLPVPVVSVAVGCSHMLAMTAGGQVYGWGRNAEGQLGLGNTSPQYSPVPIGSLSNISAIAAGASHSVVLVGDGSIRTFGDNGEGQLGTGGIGGQLSTPQAPAGVTHVTSIAAGWYHTVLGVQSAASAPPYSTGNPLVRMHTAGNNFHGQLGRGTLFTDSGAFALAVSLGAPPTIRHTALSVTDGSNMLWRNVSTGENVFWGSNSILPASPYAYLDPAPVPWQVIGTADLNFDRASEIFWYNTATGEIAFWSHYPSTPGPTDSSPGTAALVDYGSIGVTPPATNWRPVAVGDIDGDGSADVIWRHLGTGEISAWYLSATGAVLRGQSLGVPGAAWSVVNTGDFDGNGIHDIFFRNTATGEAAAWLMTAVPGKYRSVSYGPVNLTYTPQVITDLDGDGRSDVFWRNQSTGANYLWYINGTAVDGHATMPAPSAWRAQQSWLVTASNAFAAIIWRNTSTGEVGYWTYPDRAAGTIDPLQVVILGTVPLAWQLTAQ